MTRDVLKEPPGRVNFPGGVKGREALPSGGHQISPVAVPSGGRENSPQRALVMVLDHRLPVGFDACEAMSVSLGRVFLSGTTPFPAVACANLTESPDVMHTCA